MGEDLASACECREEYGCYKTTFCEKQAGGQCGWTQAQKLKSCLDVGTSVQESAIYADYNGSVIGYDTEPTLKSRYSATYQHTFVGIDGESNPTQTIQGPAQAQLKSMVGIK